MSELRNNVDHITRIRLNDSSYKFSILRFIYFIIYIIPLYGSYGYFLITDYTTSLKQSYNIDGLFVFLGFVPWLVTLIIQSCFIVDIDISETKKIREGYIMIFGYPLITYRETTNYETTGESIERVETYITHKLKYYTYNTSLQFQQKCNFISSYIVIANIIMKYILPELNIKGIVYKYVVDTGATSIYSIVSIPFVCIIVLLSGCLLLCCKSICVGSRDNNEPTLLNHVSEIEIHDIDVHENV